MARSIATIKAEMITAKNADTTLSGLTSTSATALWNLIFYIVAVGINIHEQIWDVFKTDIETIAANNVPGTPSWLQAKVLEFQYSSSDPQVVQLVDFIATYPTVKEELRIIAACSIKEQSNRVVKIKVAKNDPLETLTSTELDSLKDYVDKIKFAGVLTDCISQDPDRIMIEADIYFQGQYVEATLKTSIIDAINAYLLALPFDGVVTLTKLNDAIQAVTGVVDVVLKNVTIRPYSIPLISTDAVKMVYDYKTILRNKETEAGYIISEDTVGSTLDDKLNMILA